MNDDFSTFPIKGNLGSKDTRCSKCEIIPSGAVWYDEDHNAYCFDCYEKIEAKKESDIIGFI